MCTKHYEYLSDFFTKPSQCAINLNNWSTKLRRSMTYTIQLLLLPLENSLHKSKFKHLCHVSPSCYYINEI